ncbi:MAG TPA: response regulator [Gemmatimonadaceae bacterium]|nr:response regulator [Gemmatimonadaceae bacterium]
MEPTSPAAALPSPHSVLIVEDEMSIRDILAELFDVGGVAPQVAGSLGDAKHALMRKPWDLIVTDLRLGGKRDGGLQVMAMAGMLAPNATVIVLTAFPDEDNRHASLRLGATYFLEKPVDLSVIAELAARHGVATALCPHPESSAAPALRQEYGAA